MRRFFTASGKGQCASENQRRKKNNFVNRGRKSGFKAARLFLMMPRNSSIPSFMRCADRFHRLCIAFGDGFGDITDIGEAFDRWPFCWLPPAS